MSKSSITSSVTWCEKELGRIQQWLLSHKQSVCPGSKTSAADLPHLNTHSAVHTDKHNQLLNTIYPIIFMSCWFYSSLFRRIRSGLKDIYPYIPVDSPVYYMDECPICARSQVDACTWTSRKKLNYTYVAAPLLEKNPFPSSSLIWRYRRILLGSIEQFETDCLAPGQVTPPPHNLHLLKPYNTFKLLFLSGSCDCVLHTCT